MRNLAVALLSLFPFVVSAQQSVLEIFPMQGVSTVVLRAEKAVESYVVTSNSKDEVAVISAVPSGGSNGYHSSDPSWKEEKASTWGLSFVSKRYGDTLVISSKNEIQYIHHHYFLDNIELSVPTGVKVIKVHSVTNGEGAPNLVAP